MAPRNFSKLEKSELVTLSLRALPDGARGTILPYSRQIARKRSFVRESQDSQWRVN
jgi:hypothetical protein